VWAFPGRLALRSLTRRDFVGVVVVVGHVALFDVPDQHGKSGSELHFHLTRHHARYL
jgi:hypothetical protein